MHLSSDHTPTDLSKVRWRTSPAGTDARRCRQGGRDHQPLIGDAVVNDGRGPHARDREVPRGEFAGSHPRRRRRDLAPWSPACPAWSSTRASTGRLRTSNSSIDNLDARADHRPRAVRPGAVGLLFRWRTALISLHRHSAVTSVGSSHARAQGVRFNDEPDRPRRTCGGAHPRSSTTRSLTSRTSPGDYERTRTRIRPPRRILADARDAQCRALRHC